MSFETTAFWKNPGVITLLIDGKSYQYESGKTAIGKLCGYGLCV